MPHTGSDGVEWIAASAVAVLGAGGTLLVMTRRRRGGQHH
ncbi:LPXTG cell wall anchor domain-containing protein [Streptomyces sp. NRRL F-5123]